MSLKIPPIDKEAGHSKKHAADWEYNPQKGPCPEMASHTNVIRGMQSGYSKKIIEPICEARKSMTFYSYSSETVQVLV